MTPAEFRAWRARAGLTRQGLVDVLRRLDWKSVTVTTVNSWGVRGVPGHMMPTLNMIERFPQVMTADQPPAGMTVPPGWRQKLLYENPSSPGIWLCQLTHTTAAGRQCQVEGAGMSNVEAFTAASRQAVAVTLPDA